MTAADINQYTAHAVLRNSAHTRVIMMSRHRCVSVTVGWLLFMVFCGAGLVALPLDMIREFLGRPKACITKSEYMTRAKALGNKAKGIMVLPPTLSLLLNPVAV
jgi:hypothetical protein